jgi:hypothetical protein
MTTLLHTFPDANGFDNKVHRAELDYIFKSQVAATALAENYVGLRSRMRAANGRELPPDLLAGPREAPPGAVPPRVRLARVDRKRADMLGDVVEDRVVAVLAVRQFLDDPARGLLDRRLGSDFFLDGWGSRRLGADHPADGQHARKNNARNKAAHASSAHLANMCSVRPAGLLCKGAARSGHFRCAGSGRWAHADIQAFRV